jgi:hypothetical protein
MQGFRLAVLALTAAVSSAFHNVWFRLVKPQYMLLRSTNRAETASDLISKRLQCFWKAVCEGAVRRVNVTISGEEFVGCVLPTAATGLFLIGELRAGSHRPLFSNVLTMSVQLRFIWVLGDLM